MTIKRAKELCISVNGKLPRCGYEMLVSEAVESLDIRGLDDIVRNGNYVVSYWLQNVSGKFRVYKHTSTLRNI